MQKHFIILDNDILYKGDITENYVLQQLNVNFENVYYAHTKHSAIAYSSKVQSKCSQVQSKVQSKDAPHIISK